MYETYLQNEREFEEGNFTKYGGMCFECCDYEEMWNKLKLHRKDSLIKVMKSLVDELEEEKRDERKVKVFGEYEAKTYEDKEMVNTVLQLAIDKINNFISKIQ